MRVSLRSKSVRWRSYASLKVLRVVDIVMVTALYISPVLLGAEPEQPAVTTSTTHPEGHAQETRASAVGYLFIKEYRVRGGHKLQQIEVEEAVYPFLGSGRGPEDKEKAPAAVEKAYQAKGYQAVTVGVPSQRAGHGIIVLQVVESPI